MTLSSWQLFLHENKGKYTREELKRMYHNISPKGKKRLSTAGKTRIPRAKNRWVEFLKKNKGKYTRNELKEAYYKQYKYLKNRSPRRGRLSPEDIRREYHEQRYGPKRYSNSRLRNRLSPENIREKYLF